jgi:hypothetical protein
MITFHSLNIYLLKNQGKKTEISVNDLLLGDGNCSILTLTLIFDNYNQTGSPGQIREDIDNNGLIQILDLVALSNHYIDSWLE